MNTTNLTMRTHWATLLALATALLGCTRSNPGFGGADGTGSPAGDLAVVLDGASPGTDGRPLLGDGASPADMPRPADLPPANKKPSGVDILVVVDNSVGMIYAQQWLARDIDTLLKGVAVLPGSSGYRLGVVTTDMGVGAFANKACSAAGDGGKLQVPPKCPKPSGGVSYIEAVGAGQGNVPNPLAAAACYISEQGGGGCGFEQPLQAMKIALAAANGSFLRPDAALAVLLLTNEDDCSATTNTLFDPDDSSLGPYASYRCFQHGMLCDGHQPPLAATLLGKCQPGQQWLHDVTKEYGAFLQGLKPQGWTSLLVIGGPTVDPVQVDLLGKNPPFYGVARSCSETGVSGYPGFRLAQLASAMGIHGGYASICDQSYKPALQGLLLRIQAAF